MSWTITTPNVAVEPFNPHEISEVLYDFDGPKIFVTIDSDRLMRFWYESLDDRITKTVRYLVTTTTESQIKMLKSGKRTVHDLLKQPWLWAVDCSYSMDPQNAWVIDEINDVPPDYRPKQDATLFLEHMPLLSYRLVGKGLREGEVPASVIAKAVTGPTSALKRLLEAVMPNESSGRPEESFRRSYDLPAVRFAFNSFEVSFSAPAEEKLESAKGELVVYGNGTSKLKDAFAWLTNPSKHEEPEAYVLQALKELAPPAHGQIESVELRGQLIGNFQQVLISRSDRKTITQALGKKKTDEEQLMQVTGVIRELDKDHRRFTLRNRPDCAEDLICIFTEEHYDDVIEHFANDALISATGRYKTSKNLFEVGDIGLSFTINVDSPKPLLS
ncbi:hypothetical protein EJA70_15470 [Pseudomonas sp. PB103]|uniref:hypothetical protein n=1 Tax=Pseudomonas sp. PB103 TaxID=2494698 RepID=UPI00131DFDC8|nr:hypothetical protein [Pseudomonas sp. PB103]KAE9643801.1 hypothetical protein EJA70_15470 [Pseudomonas sp. PB103]